jgi:light-regulated signal transduction histidine kinase (bacteriophytochrome)
VDGWIAVVTDVTDAVRYEEQLREANEELGRANDDLNQFAFAASHDLQEPLPMITTYSELLAKAYRGDREGEAAMCVGYITEGTRRMQDLLSDLLAYTQVTRSRQEALKSRSQYSFPDTLENCKAAIQESHARVTSDLFPVSPHISCSSSKI